MQIRPAHEADVPALTDIYNDVVRNTTAIWNESMVDTADRLEWLHSRQDSGFPVLVAVDENDEALGYASFGSWRPHEGYRLTVEHSVHVRSDSRGSGIGKALLSDLIDHARHSGLHVMIAGIDGENAASIHLHEQFGFRRVGDLPQVGVKFGRWLDLAFLQLTLDERAPR